MSRSHSSKYMSTSEKITVIPRVAVTMKIKEYVPKIKSPNYKTMTAKYAIKSNKITQDESDVDDESDMKSEEITTVGVADEPDNQSIESNSESSGPKVSKMEQIMAKALKVAEERAAKEAVKAKSAAAAAERAAANLAAAENKVAFSGAAPAPTSSLPISQEELEKKRLAHLKNLEKMERIKISNLESENRRSKAFFDESQKKSAKKVADAAKAASEGRGKKK